MTVWYQTRSIIVGLLSFPHRLQPAECPCKYWFGRVHNTYCQNACTEDKFALQFVGQGFNNEVMVVSACPCRAVPAKSGLFVMVHDDGSCLGSKAQQSFAPDQHQLQLVSELVCAHDTVCATDLWHAIHPAEMPIPSLSKHSSVSSTLQSEQIAINFLANSLCTDVSNFMSPMASA